MARSLAIAGCGIALILVVAAVALWVIDPPMPMDTHRFCAQPIDAITTLWDRSRLGGPWDERCAVEVGPRTVAAGMTLIGLVALLILTALAGVTRPRARA